MSYADQALALLASFAERCTLPRVRALHLSPPPPPGGMRGEFCALELDDGSLGQSYVLLDRAWEGLTARQHAAAHDPWAGRDPLALARQMGSDDALDRTVGFAAVNALTRCLFDRAGWTPPASADSFGGLDVQPGETVGMIGHFTPLIPRLLARGAKVLVVELRADLVGERDGVRVTLDPGELRACRQVLATGTLMLNDTLDRMLAHCAQAERIALIGPSVGGPPDPLFARGVTMLGGHWVSDTRAFAQALTAGEPTNAHARKFSLAKSGYPGWTTLVERAAASQPPPRCM